MRQLPLLLLLLLCPVCATQAQELLVISFTEQATGASRVYSTAQIDSHSSLSVADGQKVILQKSSGREYRLQAPENSWSWTALEEVAVDASYIELNPRIEGEKVTVEVNYSDRHGSESVAYRGTVNGVIGQWIPLFQSAAATQSPGSRVYASSDASRQLFLKVERSE